MNGTVDGFGRALVTLSIRPAADAQSISVSAWIDTAFNGELVLPRHLIDQAGLEQTAGIEAKLADGKAVLLETFGCWLNWFNEERPVEVIANDGKFPLLGIGLLVGRRLVIDYGQLTVTIE